jgi:hypothetical protein
MKQNLHSPYAIVVCRGTLSFSVHTARGYQQLEVRVSIICEIKMINIHALTASRQESEKQKKSFRYNETICII